MAKPKVIFFESPTELRKWFSENSEKDQSVLIGYYKQGTGIASVTWSESVDEALCVGWIDGVRKRIDENRYQIRFTPRKSNSIWSSVNIDRVEALRAAGRMTAAGLRAFESRSDQRSRIYAYEQAEVACLTASQERKFKKNRTAWKFFCEQPPSYRKKMLYRIAQAKHPETKLRRLDALIEACFLGERL